MVLCRVRGLVLRSGLQRNFSTPETAQTKPMSGSQRLAKEHGSYSDSKNGSGRLEQACRI